MNDTELRKYTKEAPMRESKEEIWAFPLSSWTYYHKLLQMEWIVQMGFELNIYELDELGGMYWYDALHMLLMPLTGAGRYLQYLASTRIQQLERIRTFVIHNLEQSSKSCPTTKQNVAFQRTLSYIDFAVLEASAKRSFADGIACVSYIHFIADAFLSTSACLLVPAFFFLITY